MASEQDPDDYCTKLHLPLLKAAQFLHDFEPSAIDGLLAVTACAQIPHISALEEARRRIKRDSDIAEQTADAALDSEPEGSEVSYDSDKGPAPIDSEADSDRGKHIAVQYIP